MRHNLVLPIITFLALPLLLASCNELGSRDNPTDPGASNYVSGGDQSSSSSENVTDKSSSSEEPVGSSSSQDITSSSSVQQTNSSSLASSSSSSSSVKANFGNKSTFFWNAANGVERVITGFDDGTLNGKNATYSGGWFYYDDNDQSPAGTSYFVWPSSVQTDSKNYFNGTLLGSAQALTGTANIGTSELPYSFLGIGFSLAGSDTSQGYDVTAWSGICITYTSTSKFELVLQAHGERELTSFNNFSHTLQSSSAQITTNILWSQFKQESGWGNTSTISQITSQLNSVRINFTSTLTGTKATFAIYEIGSAGQCGQ